MEAFRPFGVVHVYRSIIARSSRREATREESSRNRERGAEKAA
jgi:hypothetical protein